MCHAIMVITIASVPPSRTRRRLIGAIAAGRNFLGRVVMNLHVTHPLLVAAVCNDVPSLDAYEVSGGDVFVCDALGRTALMLAAKCRSRDAVKWCVTRYARAGSAAVNGVDIAGWSAVVHACSRRGAVMEALSSSTAQPHRPADDDPSCLEVRRSSWNRTVHSCCRASRSDEDNRPAHAVCVRGGRGATAVVEGG